MIEKVFVPPIKIQGIKTKIVDLISENVYLTPESVWYEPFMGSGVVCLNLAPRRAVFSDTNRSPKKHIPAEKRKIVRMEVQGSLLRPKRSLSK